MNVWKDSRLRLAITRLGAEYLVAQLLMGGCAVYTGNNLLYLVFSAMLGLFLVSGWVSRLAIQGLEPLELEEGNLFARMQGGIQVRFRDRAPMRVRCLEVRLELEGGRAEPGFYPGGSASRVPRFGGGGSRVKPPLGSGGSPARMVLQVYPERRGPLRVVRLELRTAYPFGFMEKAWSFPMEQTLLVLPHPRTGPGREDGEGDRPGGRSRPGTASPDGARPFRERDALGRVYWKRTAQRGEPWVRTFEDDPAWGVRLRLDLRAWTAGPAFEQELERMSGAVLRARLQRREVSLRVEGPGGAERHEGFRPCWRALALAVPATQG
jgi:uncharacterized protein (DUF58 family)